MEGGPPACLPLPTTHSNSQGSLSSGQDSRGSVGPLASVHGGEQRHKALHPATWSSVLKNLGPPPLSICSTFS